MSQGSVLITGCSDGGIGAGLALIFQQRGYHVFATARNPAKLAALASLPNVTPLTLDVVNQEHIQAVLETVSAQTGGTLNYLINNAGRNHFMPLLDDNIDAAKGIFDINVWGPLAITQAFAPLLIKAQGTLVTISSIAGHGPVPMMGTYSASKISLELMSEVFRLELAPFHVKALSIVTGAVATNGQTYFEDWALPADSAYKKIEEKLAAGVSGRDGMPRTPVEEFATQVVDNIVNGATGKVWLGQGADWAKNVPAEGEGAVMRVRLPIPSD
ncbi:hypothetical protein N7492_005648 [Penicillium capsulatum]|uniref:Hydroxybutyrate dehydrogenase n=1 Tax=Penicillium capsulatum TaxID=69766 RepID=A0A9W9I9Z4_9EURO|nr:hypothetical protein N7492_005648 [Penicillium capsulatum]